MFYATPISVTLWICSNHKKEKKVIRNNKEQSIRNRENEILFIDARELGDGGANEEGYVLLTDDDKQKIADTYFNWQSKDWKTLYHDEPEFCYSATIEEIRRNDYTLFPSKYIDFVDKNANKDYSEDIKTIRSDMHDLVLQVGNMDSILENAVDGIDKASLDIKSFVTYSLGDLIEQTDNRNTELKFGVDDVMGMTITKEIMPTKANVVGTDLSNFKIVFPGEFVYNPRTHGKKIGLGFNQSDFPFIITWNNTSFKIKDNMSKMVLPEFLYLYFCKEEWDREACFRSWGSSTEVFSWEALCEMKISIPPVEVQEKIVFVYKANSEAKEVLERLQKIQNELSPIFIKGAIEEGSR